MLIEKINRELVRMITLSGLTPIDDLEFINSKTVFINELYKYRDKGTKDYKKENYYAVLQLYETDSKKLEMYNQADLFKTNIEEHFFEEVDEYTIDYEITKETSKKVFSDVGKFYQYTIEMTITAY